ncbi:hypothetical protein [Gordonia alkaliphila]|uniref:Uncharacterized protein n=1 Tax=Gordonia alkaliphila TaxID=1053547 RepID=A0ABP8YYX0_9ACTN
MTVLWWGLSAGGFQAAPANQQAAPGYNTAALALLQNHTPQPPESLRTIPGYPALSLLTTAVGNDQRWCLVYRGRNGEGFARAGGCRFVFADGPDSADAVWATAIDEFPELVINHHPTSAVFAAACRQLVHAVLTDTTQGVIEATSGNPTATAITAIRAVVRVLPPAVAGLYRWDSFALTRPPRGVRILAGALPREYSSTDFGTPVTAWESQHSLATTPTGTLHDDRVVEWLVQQAASGADCVAPHAQSMAEFVRIVHNDYLPILVDDVPQYLSHPSVLVTRGRRALQEWAERAPVEAMKAVVSAQTSDAVRSELTYELLELHTAAPAASNPIAFPPARQPVPNWSQHLAAIIMANYPDLGDRQHYLLQEAFSPGRPLSRFEDRCDFDDWLLEMDVDHIALMTPIPVIADEIAVNHSLPQPWVKALRRRTSCEAVLRDVAAYLQYEPAAVAYMTTITRKPDVLIRDIDDEAVGSITPSWIASFESFQPHPVAAQYLGAKYRPAPPPPPPPPVTSPARPVAQAAEGVATARPAQAPNLDSVIDHLKRIEGGTRPEGITPDEACVILDELANHGSAPPAIPPGAVPKPPAPKRSRARGGYPNKEPWHPAQNPELPSSKRFATNEEPIDEAELTTAARLRQFAAAGYAVLYFVIGLLIGFAIAWIFTGMG